MEKIFLISFFLNFCFLIFHNKIFHCLNLYDYPNKIKKHRHKVSCTGGLLFLLNFLLIFLYYLIQDLDFLLNIFNSKKKIISFLISILLVFILGLLDDKYNLEPKTKITSLIIIILISILIDESILINSLYFKNNYILHIEHFSIFFVLASFLIFMNSFNMFDGINLQASLFFSFVMMMLLVKSGEVYFFLLILTPFLVILYLNFQNKQFIGNSGSLLLSYIIGYFFLKFHGQISTLKVEDILLIILIPIYDSIRVVVIRLINKNKIFSGDNNHIHHILLKKLGLYKSIFIIQTLIIVPNVLSFFYLNLYFWIIISSLFYITLIFTLDRK